MNLNKKVENRLSGQFKNLATSSIRPTESEQLAEVKALNSFIFCIWFLNELQ